MIFIINIIMIPLANQLRLMHFYKLNIILNNMENKVINSE